MRIAAPNRASVRAASVAIAALALLGADATSADTADEADEIAFWERAVDPHRSEVEALVERAAELSDREDDETHKGAKKLLARAIELDPDAPRPRWELARLHKLAGEHEACTEHLLHASRIAPDYQPPHSVRDPPLLLDLTLAECLAASDEFSAAADRLRRILARGVTKEARVFGWLAQVEMARGRLEAADYALGKARRHRPHSAGYRFAAAVLADRAGRPSAAAEHLSSALGRDPRLRSIRSPAGRFFPAADEHYALGLAYATRAEPHRAALHFRRYLAASPVKLWDERAREHLDAITRAGLPLALEVTGSAELERSAARSALEGVRPELERCVKDTPGTLFRARLTRFVEGRADAPRNSPQPGPRVLVDEAFDTPSEALEGAITCAEALLRDLDLPHPRGSAGEYTTLEFPLLAP